MPLPARLQDMMDELTSTDDLTEKYEILIDLGRQVPPLAEELKTEANRVHGCQSLVHVSGALKEGKMQFVGQADALVVNGLLALLVVGLSGLTPGEFLALSPDFIKQTGIIQALTPSRVNGFYNIHERLKRLTEAAQQGAKS